jgi:hypothetical protein
MALPQKILGEPSTNLHTAVIDVVAAAITSNVSNSLQTAVAKACADALGTATTAAVTTVGKDLQNNQSVLVPIIAAAFQNNSSLQQVIALVVGNKIRGAGDTSTSLSGILANFIADNFPASTILEVVTEDIASGATSENSQLLTALAFALHETVTDGSTSYETIRSAVQALNN